VLELTVPSSERNKAGGKMVEETWSVGQFFDKEGYFDEIGLGDEIDKLFARLEEGKYDEPGASQKELEKKKNQ